MFRTGGPSWQSATCGLALMSEQVAQQVHLADGPGLLPDPFHHQGASVLCGSQPQRGVIVDPYPGTGVRSARPSAPGVETVVICEEDHKSTPQERASSVTSAS